MVCCFLEATNKSIPSTLHFHPTTSSYFLLTLTFFHFYSSFLLFVILAEVFDTLETRHTTMSTVVFQNTQSCFEPMSLSLKLNSPQSEKQSISDSTKNVWDCIESLSKETSNKTEVYVHPLVKRSTSMLSDKSLEMCTENLGSETGTDVTEEDVLSIMSLDSSVVEESRERRQKRPFHRMEARKPGYESLPPPLSILRGDNTIRVQPHRENGRLVMTAVSTSPRKSSIHAERSNGRLTMCLLEDFTENFDGLDEDVGSRNEETEIDCEEYMERSGEGDEEEIEELELLNGLIIEEDRDGKSNEIGGKFGIKKIQRARRCKESECGSRRLIINMKTFWVA